jgi:hypothetical protein
VVGIEFLTDVFGMFLYIVKNIRDDFHSCSYPVDTEGIKFLECTADPYRVRQNVIHLLPAIG